VWQWLRHSATVDGKPLTVARFDQLLKEEMAKLRRCGALIPLPAGLPALKDIGGSKPSH
jgi:hypothetical protein